MRTASDALVGGSLDRAVRERALQRRGVEGLEPEARFTSDSGARCYGDLWCPAARVLVEVDGFLTHAERARLRADRRRRLAGELGGILLGRLPT